MRKILFILLISLVNLVYGQDIKPIDPINFKNLQSPSFSFYTIDSSVWIYKGSVLQWTKLATARQLDTLSFLRTETDPIYSSDSSNIVWFSDLDTLGFIRSEIDPIYAIDSSYLKSHVRNDEDLDSTNEIQDLSGSGTNLSGYVISLSEDATTVVLPNESDPVYNIDKPNIATFDDLDTLSFIRDIGSGTTDFFTIWKDGPNSILEDAPFTRFLESGGFYNPQKGILMSPDVSQNHNTAIQIQNLNASTTYYPAIVMYKTNAGDAITTGHVLGKIGFVGDGATGASTDGLGAEIVVDATGTWNETTGERPTKLQIKLNQTGDTNSQPTAVFEANRDGVKVWGEGVYFIDLTTAGIDDTKKVMYNTVTGKLTYKDDIDTNTTYGISSVAGTGGANLRLSGSDASTDDVIFKGSGITTVTSTDDNTVTITSTEVDGSITNEGSLTVTAGTATTSVINSNTSGSTPVTISVDGTNLGISEVGNIITLSNLKPDTYAAVTKGDLTESVTGLQFDETRQVIGGAADLSLTAGYEIPTTTSISNWNTAYGWGNHAGLYIQSGRRYIDQRTITPTTFPNLDIQFGFTSTDISGGTPYADFINFGGYGDGSGGRKNLLLLTKSGFGLRQYQGDFGGSTYNHGYVDYWHSGNFTDNSTYWNDAYGWGNHATAGYVTLSGIDYITGGKTFASLNNHYSGHHFFDSYLNTGDHFPHYMGNPDGSGANVNMRVYKNLTEFRLFEINGRNGNLIWDGYNLLHTGNFTAGTHYQAPLTNPVTGTGTINHLPKWTGLTTQGNSQIWDDGTVISLGAGIPTNPKLQIYSSGMWTMGIGTNLGSFSPTSGALSLAMPRGYGNQDGSSMLNIVAPTSDYPYTSYATLMSVINNGNVGIGTTNPQGKVVIQGTVAPTLSSGQNNATLSVGTITGGAPNNIGGGINFGQKYYTEENTIINTGAIYSLKTVGSGGFGGGLAFFAQPNSPGNMIEVMRYNQAGAVGIGVDATELNAKLTLKTDINQNFFDLINQGEEGFRLRSRNFGSSYPNRTFNLGLYYYDQENTSINFYRGNSGTGGFMTFSTNEGDERMRIEPDGNVGIGTTTPAQKLDVNGNIRVRSISTSLTPVSLVGVDANGDFTTNIGSLASGYWTQSSGALYPKTITDEVRIGSSTDLGSQKLQIDGPSVFRLRNVNTSQNIDFITAGTGTQPYFRFEHDGNGGLRLASYDGSVGWNEAMRIMVTSSTPIFQSGIILSNITVPATAGAIKYDSGFGAIHDGTSWGSIAVTNKNNNFSIGQSITSSGAETMISILNTNAGSTGISVRAGGTSTDILRLRNSSGTDRFRVTGGGEVRVSELTAHPTLPASTYAYYSISGVPYFKRGADPAVNLASGGGGGVTTYQGLTDAQDYSAGTANYYLRVNSTGTGIVLSNATVSAHSILAHSDVSYGTIANNDLIRYSTTLGGWVVNSPDMANLVDKTSTQTIAGVKTFSNKPVFPSSNSSWASINLSPGTNPTSPSAGDIWTTTTGVYSWINGSLRRLDEISEVPYVGATNSSYTLNLATHVNARSTTNTNITITISNPSEGKTGNIEVYHTPTAPATVTVTFSVPTNYNLFIADNIHNTTTYTYRKSVKSRTTGTFAVYSYYVSDNRIYINGTQFYD